MVCIGGVMKVLLNSFLLFFALVLFAMPVFAYAVEGTMHANDYYAVSFDGEGDAIVRAKFIITNYRDKPIKEMRFQLPPNALVYYVAQGPPKNYYYYERITYYYYDYNKLDFNKERYADYLNVKVILSEELSPQSSIGIFILYKVPGLAKKDFLGNFNFDFKTAIDVDAILTERVRVAVNVQPGFSLKGAKSEVNYQQDFLSEAVAAQMREIPSEYYSHYYDIEYAQGIVKEAYSLDQYESFTVRGSYSDNGLALYLPEILIGILVLAIIFGATLFAIKRFAKRPSQSKTKGKEEEQQQQSIKELIGEAYKSAFVAVIVTSLAVAVLVIITYYGAGILMDALSRIRLVDYSYTYLLMIILMLIAASVIILELALPAYFVYKKHSLIAGIATFLLALVFLFILVLLIGIIMKL